MSIGSKKRLIEELKNKKFRVAYASEHVKVSVPIQIYMLREQRGWSQSELAERAKTTQTVISRLEDPDYGKFTIASLLKLASAYDVALFVKFIPFSRLLDEFKDASPTALSAADFTTEYPELAAWANDDVTEENSNPIHNDTKSIEIIPAISTRDAALLKAIREDVINLFRQETKAGGNQAVQEKVVSDTLIDIERMNIQPAFSAKKYANVQNVTNTGAPRNTMQFIHYLGEYYGRITVYT